MHCTSSFFLPSPSAVDLRPEPSAPQRCSPLRRCVKLMCRCSSHTGLPLKSAQRFASDWAIRNSIFVRFQPTPNETCYKFYVDDMDFLPPGSHTMMFDSNNSYQSPLAHTLLEALPMVEEVTVGTSFVTVRRVEEADAKAAARFFAMKFHGVQDSQEMDESAAAARSQALQQHVENARHEAEGGGTTNAAPQTQASPPPSSPSSGFAAEAPIELGGFTVTPSAQDEQVDEAAIAALIAATDWSELKFHVSALLTDHISSGSPHVDPTAPNPHADTVPEEGDSEVVLMIKELVAATIRPQLQDDGGDLRFVGFDADSGEMRVELLGACRKCKSSKTTLVDLIERTTRHWIPEVKAVKDVSRVIAFYQRVAEDAVAEEERNHSVSDLVQDMEMHQSDEGTKEPTLKTVQFAPSAEASEDSSGKGYRIVREVKAAARGRNGNVSTAVAASSS
jgi:Fe-S cluster biogenesis protein NfuA